MRIVQKSFKGNLKSLNLQLLFERLLMQIFYSEQIDSTHILLADQEAIHCSKVLRKKIGDRIHVIDGKGKLYSATINTITKKAVHLSIDEIVRNEKLPKHLPTIGIGLIKNSARLEWFIEKAVEIGVKEIYPIYCKRSERSKIKPERINKIIMSAVKQSKRLWIPTLAETKKLDQIDWVGEAYVGHYSVDHNQLHQELHNAPRRNNIIIGPEGDFTSDEIQFLKKNDGIMVNLGHSRLRTETAGIVALTLMNNKI